ncbi:MAG: 3-oxoacyl-[acyl-carrier-protein] reductase [Elusimicrobia bacterium]|nr:3-oxoacyl-[acyl-carrier-protein] reductase [Elusimicrobiota bacterium]
MSLISSRTLKDRVAILTGAAQGIGEATARLFAEAGAKLVLCDLEEEKLELSAKKIAAAHGTEILTLKTDVTRPQDCETAVQRAIDRFKKIDILINNAGVTRDGLLLRMSDEDWNFVMDVNLKGAFFFIRAVLRPMVKQRSGRIVNIASVIGQMGNAGQANYAASKGGLIALTKTCARELASRNILINAIAPGFIRTRLTEVLPEEVKKQHLASIPLGRFGEPEEIASAALFLASDDSPYITGQVLGVNGGSYM